MYTTARSDSSPSQKSSTNNNFSSNPRDGEHVSEESVVSDSNQIKPSSEKPEYLISTRTGSDLSVSLPTTDLIFNSNLNELKITDTEYSTELESDLDKDPDYDTDDDLDTEWDYNLEDSKYEENEEVDNLSRTKRRKDQFTKKTFGRRYDGNKGGKTSGRQTMQPGEPGFGGEMKKRRKTGRFSNEYYIKRHVLKNYDRTTRPVKNDTTTVTVFVGMSLYHILDTVCYTSVNLHIEECRD